MQDQGRPTTAWVADGVARQHIGPRSDLGGEDAGGHVVVQRDLDQRQLHTTGTYASLRTGIGVIGITIRIEEDDQGCSVAFEHAGRDIAKKAST